MRVDRIAGAEHGDQRAGSFGRRGVGQRLFERLAQRIGARGQILEFVRIDDAAAHEIQARYGWIGRSRKKAGVAPRCLSFPTRAFAARVLRLPKSTT